MTGIWAAVITALGVSAAAAPAPGPARHSPPPAPGSRSVARAVPRAPGHEAGSRARSGPASGLQVWLLTVGPGSAAYSRFGHSALRVRDPRSGGDVVFDFGTFDEAQPNVLGRFLRGRLAYELSVSTYRETLAEVRAEGRRLVAQALRLTDAESRALFRDLRARARPGRRGYRYHHFYRNCATQIRDALDAVLGGALRRQLRGVPAGTHRGWIRRATRGAPWFHLGFDLILTHADRPIDLWDAAFAPEALAQGLGRIRLPWPRRSGRLTPLVRSAAVVLPGPGFGAPPGAPESRRWPVLLLTALLLGLLAPWLAGRRDGAAPAWAPRLAGLSLLLLGLGHGLLSGAFLFLESYARLEQFRGNPLLLLLPPTGVLLVAPGGWLLLRGASAASRWQSPRARWIARVVSLELILATAVWCLPWDTPNPWGDLWPLMLLTKGAGLGLLYRGIRGSGPGVAAS